MTLQHQRNRSAPSFFFKSRRTFCNIPCGRQETRHGMAPRRLVLRLVISSKWLPKHFIQMFKKYLRAKLQAPVHIHVIVWTLFFTNTFYGSYIFHMARTLRALLPCLVKTRSWVPMVLYIHFSGCYFHVLFLVTGPFSILMTASR